MKSKIDSKYAWLKFVNLEFKVIFSGHLLREHPEQLLFLDRSKEVPFWPLELCVVSVKWSPQGQTVSGECNAMINLKKNSLNSGACPVYESVFSVFLAIETQSPPGSLTRFASCLSFASEKWKSTCKIDNVTNVGCNHICFCNPAMQSIIALKSVVT